MHSLPFFSDKLYSVFMRQSLTENFCPSFSMILRLVQSKQSFTILLLCVGIWGCENHCKISGRKIISRILSYYFSMNSQLTSAHNILSVLVSSLSSLLHLTSLLKYSELHLGALVTLKYKTLYSFIAAMLTILHWE